MAIGHTKNSEGVRQDLSDHLEAVAALTEALAESLGAADIGRYLGLWHDVGKFHPDFQDYLLRCEASPKRRSHGPDHKAAGALLARDHAGHLFSMLIQAHHGGLRSPVEWRSWLDEHVDTGVPGDALRIADAEMSGLHPDGQLPLPRHVEDATSPLVVEMFLRLLYSALVDADSLDTERHRSPEVSAMRATSVPIETLWRRFERSQAKLDATPKDSVVIAQRRRVYRACLAAAEAPPGIFRLTVPTGGGKTRSAMAFALRHALRNDQRRVVVAVPYLTITDQTADVYREIFNDSGDAAPAVLEHHSGVDETGPGDEFDPVSVATRLATENWDAPIVVTTTVQLFESLFASRRSRCRKLHQLAGSVIILDEAQALPSRLLRPILDCLRDLAANYGSTVVFSTATQPSFESIAEFASVPATEILPDARSVFSVLRRVQIHWETGVALTWAEVAARLAPEEQLLVILNTKRDAVDLIEAMSDGDVLHLSTALCGAHRREIISEVKRRLNGGERCRLVATQVVEAGVDLDFPVVWRAFGPLDGVIQAAGRCNREGSLDRGRVVVFEPAEGGMPPGDYRAGAEQTRRLLVASGDRTLEADDPATATEYFRALYQLVDTDAHGIQRLRAALDYPEVDRRFRMIDEDTESLVVAFGTPDVRRQVDGVVDALMSSPGNGRSLLRKVQPFLVTVRRRTAERYRREGLIEPILPGVGRWLGRYDQVLGLLDGQLGAEALVV